MSHKQTLTLFQFHRGLRRRRNVPNAPPDPISDLMLVLAWLILCLIACYAC